MEIDSRVSVPDFVKEFIVKMLGEDYAKHAILKYSDNSYGAKNNGLCLDFRNGLKVKKIFHQEFIDLLWNIESERKRLTKDVSISFDNLDSVKRDIELYDVAKIDKELTGAIELQKQDQTKDSFLEYSRLVRRK